MRTDPGIAVLLPLAVWLAAGGAAYADGTGPLTQGQVREILDRTVSVRSSDGLTLVVGDAGFSGADALRLCQFATDVRKRLSALLGVPLEGAAFSTEFRILEKREGADSSIACAVTGQGTTRIRVWVTGLDEVAPEDVTSALCGGLLRADALAHGWQDYSQCELGADPYPVWFGTGVARLLDLAVRQADAEHVVALLEKGELSPLSKLAEAAAAQTLEDGALASQLVAWALDDADSDAFPALRMTVLLGQGWSTEVFTALGRGAAENAEEAWREWIRHRKWVVLTPGKTEPEFVRRMRPLLSLLPLGVKDPAQREGLDIQDDVLAKIPISAFDGPDGIDPEGLYRNRMAPWAPEAALAISGRLQRAASGHSPELLEAAAAYGAFFQAVADRKPAAELRELLDQAEKKLADLSR